MLQYQISVDVVPNDPVDVRCGGPQWLGFDFVIEAFDAADLELKQERIGALCRKHGIEPHSCTASLVDEGGRTVWTTGMIEAELEEAKVDASSHES